MICSASELGLDNKMSDGIMVLNGKWEPGTDVKSVLGMDDEVLELDLTPNRSDCLSIIGVAYEVAALFDRELNIRYSEPLLGEAELPAKVELVCRGRLHALHFASIAKHPNRPVTAMDAKPSDSVWDSPD